jgi:hypothetical protein
MFAIQHTETGKYVASPGSYRSYTNCLEEARIFRSRDIAEKERCVESETIVDLQHLFNRLIAKGVSQ